MACALRKCVYVILSLCAGLQAIAVYGKSEKALNTETNLVAIDNHKDQFQWMEHPKLSWDDFQGVINATNNESAAATNCGIGIKTSSIITGSKPQIIVYNTFHVKKSWVRKDAKVQSILDHEQGHFDLCEIYTRKLRERINNFDLNLPNAKQALMDLYAQLNNEYEIRQQAYELETVHGTDMIQQKKWLEVINEELSFVPLIATSVNTYIRSNNEQIAQSR